MLKLVMMPPQNDLQRQWAPRLQRSLPDYRVVVPETEAEARHELLDADAAYGWVPPDMLPASTKLRWLQNPQAGPAPGYYYPALIAHPVVVCNSRGIYFDHISHHILMFVLALSRGLPDYLEAQRQRRWDQQARQHPYVYLGEATALIVGVGGIGHETARLCTALGMTVLGVDPRPEYDVAGVEIHPVADLDTLLPRADFVMVTTPAYARDGGHVARAAVLPHEAHSVFHQRGARQDHAPGGAGRRAGAGPHCRVWARCLRGGAAPGGASPGTLPNVLLTPHIAVRDAENLPERRFQVLLDNARRFAAGEPLRNVVDKAAWY